LAEACAEFWERGSSTESALDVHSGGSDGDSAVGSVRLSKGGNQQRHPKGNRRANDALAAFAVPPLP